MHKQNLQNVVNYIFKNDTSYKYKFLGSNSEDSTTDTAVHTHTHKKVLFWGEEEGNLVIFGPWLPKFIDGFYWLCDYDL